MQIKLTDPQRRALGFIHESISKRGTPPTLREICELMGYKAIGSVQDLVKALRRKGFLEVPDKQFARALQLTTLAKEALSEADVETRNILNDIISVPCLGFVPAGNPLEAVEAQYTYFVNVIRGNWSDKL